MMSGWAAALPALDAIDIGWEILRLQSTPGSTAEEWRAVMLALPDGVSRREVQVWARERFIPAQRRWWGEVGGPIRPQRELLYLWLSTLNADGAWRLLVLRGMAPEEAYSAVQSWVDGPLPDGGPKPLPWGWLDSPPRTAAVPWDGEVLGASPVLPEALWGMMGAEWEEALWAMLRARYATLDDTPGEAALHNVPIAPEDWTGWTKEEILGWLREAMPERLCGAEVLAMLSLCQRPDLFGAADRYWRLLVRCGADPEAVLTSQPPISPARRELPGGQWLPPELLTVLGAHQQGMQLGVLWLEMADVEVAMQHIRNNEFIPAVKHIRNITRSGLREAKEAADELRARGADFRRRIPAPRRRERTGTWPLMERAIDGLLMEYPLHWVILSSLRIVEDRGVPTMAVASAEGASAVLFYNPAFVEGITEEERKGVLVHEINHVIFGHLDRPYNVNDHPAWRIACECTANEYVRYPLPGSPVTLDQFALPPGESTTSRYHRLLKMGPLPDLQTDILLWSVRALAAHHQDRMDHPPQNAWTLVRGAAELVADELSEEQIRAVGLHSGQSWAEQLYPDGIGTLPWEEVLKRGVRGLMVRYATRRHPSRRQPDLVGIVPGRRSRRDPPSVLFVVDTSGSMTAQELTAISEELNGLCRRQVEVTLMQCDDLIREEVRVTPGFVFNRVKGRGGTDFRPPFAEPIMRRLQPDLLVYFTDGYGPAPAAAPPDLEVLWVLTGHAPVRPAAFGQVTTMRPRGQRARVQSRSGQANTPP